MLPLSWWDEILKKTEVGAWLTKQGIGKSTLLVPGVPFTCYAVALQSFPVSLGDGVCYAERHLRMEDHWYCVEASGDVRLLLGEGLATAYRELLDVDRRPVPDEERGDLIVEASAHAESKRFEKGTIIKVNAGVPHCPIAAPGSRGLFLVAKTSV